MPHNIVFLLTAFLTTFSAYAPKGEVDINTFQTSPAAKQTNATTLA